MVRARTLLLALGLLGESTSAFAQPPPQPTIGLSGHTGDGLSYHDWPETPSAYPGPSAHSSHSSYPAAPTSVTVKQKSSKAKTAAALGLGTAGVTALFMTADGADDTADAVEDLGGNIGSQQEVSQAEAPGGTATPLPGYVGP
jgi:hypothetical protein